MKRRNMILVLVLGVVVLAALALSLSGWSPITLAGMVLNTFRTANSPAGTLVVELRESSPVTAIGTTGAADTSSRSNAEPFDAGSWPSYNRTLTSQRYSPLNQINTQTVGGLKVLCSYDTHLHENFNPGPLMVDGALIGTTVHDTFSINPSTCRENWRTHEDFKPWSLLLNRGAAYLDRRVFRGTQDGRVLAYDFKTGQRLWATTIADPKTGEIVSAAPIAWNGLVFIGNALGDVKGVKGRMYALAPEDGRIVWETYLVPKEPEDPVRGPQGRMPASAITTWENAPDVPISGGATWTSYTLDPATGRLYVPVANGAPDFVKHLREGLNLYTNSIVVLDAKTGAYIDHFPAAPEGDWHDWDVSNAPSIFMTRGGTQLLSFAPKNGHLYGFDLATRQLRYRRPVTRIENADVPLSTDKDTHFCPGSAGGGEWNGVAYDPQTNLVLTGQSEWCTTVRLQPDVKVKAAKDGEPWMGNSIINPLHMAGIPDRDWAGWVYATDADSGEWKWRSKSNYPTLSGITPTGGGLVFFGDMGGNFYAVDASTGRRLWGQKLEGAVGGGVITYMANGSQRVAVAAGISSIVWPTEVATAKIVILGLGEPAR
jgi:PQQ-dependent dehydrogenase (methanol/ethanol family)